MKKLWLKHYIFWGQQLFTNALSIEQIIVMLGSSRPLTQGKCKSDLDSDIHNLFLFGCGTSLPGQDDVRSVADGIKHYDQSTAQ